MVTKKEILKLESLLYLYALSKSSSKREVARDLGTSVDTINKYIANLEDDLHTHLLMSGGRGTTITPEGQRILKISDTIIKAMREMGNYSEGAAAYKGTVRLCMTDAISDYIGPEKIFEFMQKYPDIQLETTISEKIPDMNTLEADIYLGYEPHYNPDTILITTKEVHCDLFAAQRYIDTYGKPKDMQDLINNHRICDKTEHDLYAPGWKEVIERAKHIVYRTNSISSFHYYLKEGVGIGLCPLVFGTDLVRLRYLGFGFYVNLYLMAHKDIKDMPRIRLVLDYLKDIINNKPTW